MMKKFISACLMIFIFAISTSAEYRILAFGDSNTWDWIPNGGGTRYSDTERWAGVLQAELGDGYTVICDGLVARRTNLDGTTAGLIEGSFLNGAKTLPASIARNAPIDLVILFLGTNDLQLGAEPIAGEVASAVAELAQLAFGDLSSSALKDLFTPGHSESEKLSSAFKAMATTQLIRLIHTNMLQVDGIGPDGIHLNRHGHELLGKALSRAVLGKHKELRKSLVLP